MVSGAVAQSVERPPEKWKVTSSILVRATIKTPILSEDGGFAMLAMARARSGMKRLMKHRAAYVRVWP